MHARARARRLVLLEVQLRDALEAQPAQARRTNGIARPRARSVCLASPRATDDRYPHIGVAQVGLTSTSVMVTKPMRGSSTSRRTMSLISSRSSSSSAPCARSSATCSSGDDDARDRLLAEALDDVALLELVEAGQPDAALVAGRRPRGRRPGSGAATRCDRWRSACRRGRRARRRARCGRRSRSSRRSRRGRPEDLAHLGAALDDLDHLRLEQAAQRGTHLLGQLVDDVVEADVDALGLGRARAPADRAWC